jgi:type II secretory pathway component PulL
VPRGNAPDPERQIRRKLQELSGSDTSSSFVSLVETIGGVVSGKKGARIASINYNARSGDMRMNIVASDYEAVEAIRLAITAKGLEATMESSNSQGGEVRARMRVKS